MNKKLFPMLLMVTLLLSACGVLKPAPAPAQAPTAAQTEAPEAAPTDEPTPALMLEPTFAPTAIVVEPMKTEAATALPSNLAAAPSAEDQAFFAQVAQDGMDRLLERVSSTCLDALAPATTPAPAAAPTGIPVSAPTQAPEVTAAATLRPRQL